MHNPADAVFCSACGNVLRPNPATGPTVRLSGTDGGTGNQVPLSSPYGAPYGSYAVPQQSGTALIACVLGIVSFFLMVLPGSSLLTAIPAIIVGRNAQREIHASRGQLTGEGLARTGVALGWITIAFSVIGFCAICALFAVPFGFLPFVR
jgi:hypothetical protein